MKYYQVIRHNEDTNYGAVATQTLIMETVNPTLAQQAKVIAKENLTPGSSDWFEIRTN